MALWCYAWAAVTWYTRSWWLAAVALTPYFFVFLLCENYWRRLETLDGNLEDTYRHKADEHKDGA